MKKYSIIILILLLQSGCNFEDSDPVEKLNHPDLELYKQYNFIVSDSITYQFYHEYGFTDLVWQMVTITKPDSPPNYPYQLPLDTNQLKVLEHISLEKFIEGKPILFSVDLQMNSDVSVIAKEYYPEGSDLDVEHKNGSYNFEKKGNIEMIRVYDADKGLEYIELNKVSW